MRLKNFLLTLCMATFIATSAYADKAFQLYVVGETQLGGEFAMSSIQEVSLNASVTTNITQASLLVYNGQTVGTANLVLPQAPRDGEIVNIISKPAITVATVTAGSKTVNGAVTAMSANTTIAYIYSAITTAWHKFK